MTKFSYIWTVLKLTLHITRTIKVSWFVMLFAWFWATYQDHFITRHPDSHSCTQLKSCTLTNFRLRDKLYRDTAPVPFTKLIYREKYPATYKTCTATSPAPDKIRTQTAKSTPYLSCHRDNFPAKVPGPVAGWLRQVTQPPFIAGPLCLICNHVNTWYDSN